MYKEMVKANYGKIQNDEKIMWASVALVDGLLEEMREHYKKRYWQFMRDAHEIMCGKHYDEEYAEWDVSQMYHKSPDGREYKGAHWSIEQTSDVMQSYRGKLPHEITPYDFFVALNAQWHDYICWARDRFDSDEDADIAVIDMAVRFWFLDDDWGEPTKVWDYFRMKNE